LVPLTIRGDIFFFQFEEGAFERIVPRVQFFELLTNAINFSPSEGADASVSAWRLVVP
jgi:hypothetical protein